MANIWNFKSIKSLGILWKDQSTPFLLNIFPLLVFRFDENGDGVISHKEMKKFVKDIQALLSPSELESIDER